MRDANEPVSRSATNNSNTLVANNSGAVQDSSSIRFEQRAPIASGVVADRAGGGPPSLSHFQIVAAW